MILSILDQGIKLVEGLFEVFLSIFGIIILGVPLVFISIALVAWLAFYFFRKQKDVKDIEKNLLKFIASSCGLVFALWTSLLSSFITPYFTSLGFLGSGLWGFVIGLPFGLTIGVAIFLLIYFKVIKNFYFKTSKIVLDSKVMLRK